MIDDLPASIAGDRPALQSRRLRGQHVCPFPPAGLHRTTGTAGHRHAITPSSRAADEDRPPSDPRPPCPTTQRRPCPQPKRPPHRRPGPVRRTRPWCWPRSRWVSPCGRRRTWCCRSCWPCSSRWWGIRSSACCTGSGCRVSWPRCWCCAAAWRWPGRWPTRWPPRPSPGPARRHARCASSRRSCASSPGRCWRPTRPPKPSRVRQARPASSSKVTVP